MNKFLKVLTLVSVIMLSGCYGSYYEPEPVGVGTQPEELKLSPCACIEIETPQTLPVWFAEQMG